MIESFNLTEHIGTRSKPPDHSFLLFDYQFKPSSHYTDHQQNAQEAIISSKPTPKKRFKVRHIPADFMSSDLVKRAISEVIRTIEFCRENQDEIDNIYSEFCDIISKEMENKLQCNGGSKKTRKRLRKTKSYWNDELSSLWKNMHDKEKSVS